MNPETVTLKLEVPKGVLDFLADLFTLGGTEQTPKEFLQEELVSSVKSIVGSLPNTWFNAEDILKRYGLDKP
jgi:hypothetical protein